MHAGSDKMKTARYLLPGVAILFLCATHGIGAERRKFTASVDTDGVQRVEIVPGSHNGIISCLPDINQLHYCRVDQGATSFWRTPHFMIGSLVILFYLIQIFPGLDILL